MIWMKLKDIMLNEISQAQKDKYFMTSLIFGIQNNQMYRNRLQNGGYNKGMWQRRNGLVNHGFLFMTIIN